MFLDIYGRETEVCLLKDHGCGTIDVERKSDGKCFRITGLPLAKRIPEMKKAVRQNAKRKKVNKKTSNASPRPSPPPPDQEGDLIVLHGLSGVGKSSFAAHFPNPQFVLNKHDRGILRLARRGLVPSLQFPTLELGTWEDCEKIWPEEGARTLVVDTVTGVEKLCFQAVMEEQYDSDREFWSYGHQGAKNAATRQWPEFLDRLTEISMTGVTVILVCHSQVKTFKNPGGTDYHRWVPFLHEAVWSYTFGWASDVFFLEYETSVEKEKGQLRAKGKGGEDRNILTEWSATYDAKTQSNLPPVIPMGSSGEEAFQNFAKHYYQ